MRKYYKTVTYIGIEQNWYQKLPGPIFQRYKESPVQWHWQYWGYVQKKNLQEKLFWKGMRNVKKKKMHVKCVKICHFYDEIVKFGLILSHLKLF